MHQATPALRRDAPMPALRMVDRVGFCGMDCEINERAFDDIMREIEE